MQSFRDALQEEKVHPEKYKFFLYANICLGSKYPKSIFLILQTKKLLQGLLRLQSCVASACEGLWDDLTQSFHDALREEKDHSTTSIDQVAVPGFQPGSPVSALWTCGYDGMDNYEEQEATWLESMTRHLSTAQEISQLNVPKVTPTVFVQPCYQLGHPKKRCVSLKLSNTYGMKVSTKSLVTPTSLIERNPCVVLALMVRQLVGIQSRYLPVSSSTKHAMKSQSLMLF